MSERVGGERERDYIAKFVNIYRLPRRINKANN